MREGVPGSPGVQHLGCALHGSKHAHTHRGTCVHTHARTHLCDHRDTFTLAHGRTHTGPRRPVAARPAPPPPLGPATRAPGRAPDTAGQNTTRGCNSRPLLPALSRGCSHLVARPPAPDVLAGRCPSPGRYSALSSSRGTGCWGQAAQPVLGPSARWPQGLKRSPCPLPASGPRLGAS